MSRCSRYKSEPRAGKACRSVKASVTGLPEEVFLAVTRLTPMINVDLLIKDTKGRTLLTWRDDGYWKPGWHIPGGIIRFKERISGRIAKTARGELGVGVKHSAEPLAIKEFIHPARDERGHFISLLYGCSISGNPDPALAYRSGKPKPGQWAWHDGCPDDLLEVHKVYREFI